MPAPTARAWAHAGGLAWLAATGLVFLQAALGRPTLALAPLPAAAFLALLAWGWVTLRTAVLLRRMGS